MTDLAYLHCPLRDCDWRTVDRSHLGTVVVVSGTEDDDSRPRLTTVPAWQQMHGELLEHLRSSHRDDLLLMVAGMESGHGEPQIAQITQHIDARQVRDAASVVVSVLVPQMRGALARKLATENLRPVDPWPAVQVAQYVWTSPADYADSMNGHADHPPGMRPLQQWEAAEGHRPDLYVLRLETLAVPDRRTVAL